ncbi:hypothetical protein C2S52_017962 [Perilla frutescens var. hirtella]|nr:hypothetical protein C2S52_017962 [Perilla frutescens var. hirtella]
MKSPIFVKLPRTAYPSPSNLNPSIVIASLSTAFSLYPLPNSAHSYRSIPPPPPPKLLILATYRAHCQKRSRSLKVAILLSGGVDSSVGLRLLHAAGHSCTAFYLKFEGRVRNQTLI